MPRITKHLRTNVVGYVALFLALSAGAYAAGLAPNSVKSEHIVNGEVRNAELRADAVTGPKVAASSLSGSDLGPNSLGGQQIAENTLGEVPNATIAGHGGYGRQSGGPETGTGCDPAYSAWITCASVELTPSAQARFLVTGRFTVSPDDEFGYAECRLGSSVFGGIPGTTIPLYVATNNNVRETVTLTGITGVYQPGSYSFGIDCRDTESGDYGAHMKYARVTAVAISPF